MKPRAAVYCRVSTLQQAKAGYSLEEQASILPALAMEQGYRVEPEDVFKEVKSGANDDRPEYNRLLARVSEGYYQAVFVIEKSRLSRTEDRAEEQRIIDIFRKFGCVIRTPGITFDFSTIEGRFVTDVHGAVDRMERERIKYRMMTGKQAKLKQGGYTGGLHPRGYKPYRDLETGEVRFCIDEKEMEVVREAFKLALKGLPPYSIAKELYLLGYLSAKGTRIFPATVKKWITNPNYAGYTTQGHRSDSKAKRVLIETNNYFQPIVTKSEFKRVQEYMERRSYPMERRERSPLGGIIRCPSCGEPQRIGFSNDRPYYVCAARLRYKSCDGSKGKQIPCDTAHELLIQVIQKLLHWVERHADVNDQSCKIVGQTGSVPSAREKLLKQQAEISRRIAVHLKDQEDQPSDFRKARILELEAQYTDLAKKIKSTPTEKAQVLPSDFLPLAEAVKELTAKDEVVIKQLASLIFATLRWRRLEGYSHGRFALTSFETVWGARFRVRSNGGLSLQP